MFFRKEKPIALKPQTPRPQVATAGPEAALADLALLDPGFTLEGFYKEAEKIFKDVKSAIWKGDPHPLAQYLDEPALAKMIFQARRYSSQNQELLVDGLEMVEVKVISYPDNVPGIELGVLFHFKTYDERIIDAQSGQVISVPGGSHHREVWVFVRDVNVTNKGSSGIDPRCPHCSAPLDLIGGLCKYCKAPVRTEEGAWQVIKISVTA